VIGFSVDPNLDDIAGSVAYFNFVGGQTTDAVRIAINKAGPKVRSGSTSTMPSGSISRRIRDEIRVTASYLNERNDNGTQRLGFSRATRNSLSGAITTQSRGILLSRFEWNPRVSLIGGILFPENPIRVRVKPASSGGSIKPLSGGNDVQGSAFYIRLRNSGAIGLAKFRVGGGIKVFYGPSVSQVFTEVKEEVLQSASDVYQAELLDAMRYILNGRPPPEPS